MLIVTLGLTTPPSMLSAVFLSLKDVAMPTSSFFAHNPAALWQVPDAFRSVYSHATEAVAPSRMLFISGQFGVAPDGRLPPDFAAQCERAMDNVEALLAAAGMTTANIVKLNYYATQATDFPILVQTRQRRWAFDPAPAVTAIAVSALARPEYLIEIEAVAIVAMEQSP
jgi:enamine deaminase RidA (YjgF/YER057c/UK114 family)